jgi:uncharacterized protein (DUF4213/DUF364 family)
VKEDIYSLLLDVLVDEQRIEEVVLGLTWTYCRTEGVGLSMSPVNANGLTSRTLEWPGSLQGRKTSEVATWIRDWNPYKSTIGMSVINSVLNQSNDVLHDALVLKPTGSANLAVFEYFRNQLQGKRVVVIGRYPGLDTCLAGLDYTVLERQPGQGDLPDTAAEYVIRDADWVFLTSTSIVNKTFMRLAELSQDANLVLMGPTTPWIAELAEFGVDYLAGVSVTDPVALKTTVAEGGGTRIFDAGVQYRIADLGAKEMGWIKTAISDTVFLRERIKSEMESWYAKNVRERFPRQAELLSLDSELSKLDNRFKRLWDARH